MLASGDEEILCAAFVFFPKEYGEMCLGDCVTSVSAGMNDLLMISKLFKIWVSTSSFGSHEVNTTG